MHLKSRIKSFGSHLNKVKTKSYNLTMHQNKIQVCWFQLQMLLNQRYPFQIKYIKTSQLKIIPSFIIITISNKTKTTIKKHLNSLITLKQLTTINFISLITTSIQAVTIATTTAIITATTASATTTKIKWYQLIMVQFYLHWFLIPTVF